MKKPRRKGKLPMIAFSVQEPDENTGGIFFTQRRGLRAVAEVTRRGEARDYGDRHELQVCRLPWADRYAPGPVPFQAMVRRGWWCECTGCGRMINNDELYDRKLPIEGVSGVDGGMCFCSIRCRRRFFAERETISAEEARALAAMRQLALEKLPAGIEIVEPGPVWQQREHAYVTRDRDGKLQVEQCFVSFDFPGRTIGMGQFGFRKLGDEPDASVCYGDLKAWQAFAADSPFSKQEFRA